MTCLCNCVHLYIIILYSGVYGGYNQSTYNNMETKNTYLKHGYHVMTKEQLLNRIIGLKK